jgi:hypothetical protein
VLIREALSDAEANDYTPLALYYPGMGQSWFTFREDVFVYVVGIGTIGRWSRYRFPFEIEYHTQLAGHLYLRSGDVVRRVTPDVNYDEIEPLVGGSYTKDYYDLTVQWPWIDLGGNAQMEGFEIVSTGGVPYVSVGYNQKDINAFTEEYAVDYDTMPDEGIIPMPISAPALSIRVRFAGGAGRFPQLNMMKFYTV